MSSIFNRLRPLDGYEWPLVFPWLSISDEVEGISNDFNIISENLKNGLKGLEILQLAIEKDENGHFFWVKGNYNPILKRSEPKTLLSGKCLPIQSPKDINNPNIELLYYIEYCPETKRLGLIISHTIVDGRTILELFDYIRRAAKGEIINEIKLELCEFGQKNNYKDKELLNLINTIPESWKKVIDGPVLPIVEPCDYSIDYFSFEYSKVREICIKDEVSIQSLLMAVMTRSARKYNNLPIETPISIYSPTDTRCRKYATEEFKNRHFFCGAGASYPQVIGQNDLISDIKNCKKALMDALLTPDACLQILKGGECINPETLEFKPIEGLPDLCKHHVVGASHIGKIPNGGKCPVFAIHIPGPNIKSIGTVVLYAIHTDEMLSMLFLHPELIDNKFIEIVLNEIKEIFLINELKKI